MGRPGPQTFTSRALTWIQCKLGKAVTLPWESNPEPLLTYTDNFREPGANLRYFMMLIVRLLAIPTQDLLAL